MQQAHGEPAGRHGQRPARDADVWPGRGDGVHRHHAAYVDHHVARGGHDNPEREHASPSPAPLTDSGGGVVAGVEVSTDGGQSWHPVTTMSAASTSVTWSYTWSALGAGNVTIETRATDDSGNIQTSPSSETVTVNCPCGLYGQNYTPSITSSSDPTPLSSACKFTSTVSGWVTGVRFYKGTGNNGTHTGSLWTASGTQLATGTFTNETASGWQTLHVPVPGADHGRILSYVAGYYDPEGYYASDMEQFYPGMYGSTDLSPLDSPPADAVRATCSTGNGVFNLGGPGFPTSSYNGSGYGVDVIFTNVAPADRRLRMTGTTPSTGANERPGHRRPEHLVQRPGHVRTSTFTVTGPGGTAVSGTASLNSTETISTFTRRARLPPDTTYTASVSGVLDVIRVARPRHRHVAVHHVRDEAAARALSSRATPRQSTRPVVTPLPSRLASSSPPTPTGR